MADTEQEGVSPATAGGASAPWTIRKHGGRTVSLHEGDEPRALVFEADHAARILAALNPPPLPPFKLRPVLGEPAVNMDGDEDGNEWPDSVGWSLSLGCQLTFGHDGDETGDATAQVSMSDMDLRRGKTKRTATRAQVAAFGRLLVEQFGEPAGPDQRDAEIERLRGELAKSDAASLRYIKERDEAREERTRADAEVTRLKREADQRQKFYGGLVNRIHEALHDERRVEVANRGGLANAVLRLAYAFAGVCDERDRLRAELDAVRSPQRAKFEPGQYVRIGSCQGMVVKPRDITRVQLLGMLQEADFPTRALVAIPDDEPIAPRRWVAGDPEPEVGTVVRRDTYEFTRHIHGWHRNGACKFTADECPNRGGSWVWMTSTGRPLYEVVSTDA